MSLNIPVTQLRAAESVTIKFKLSRLGPRQQAALRRYLKTGKITAGGVAADIAQSMLDEVGAKYVRARRYGGIWFGSITEDERQKLIDATVAYAVKRRLDTPPNANKYYVDMLELQLTRAKEGKYVGDGYCYNLDQDAAMEAIHVEPPNIPYPTDDLVDITVYKHD